MATSVPVDERTKARLERLRAAIERETGRTVTQRELLARLVDREFERESLVESFREEMKDETNVDSRPSESVDPESGKSIDERSEDSVDLTDFEDDEFEGLSEEETERWLSGTTASGNPVSEDEIDEVLYGSPDEFAEDE